MDRIIFFSMAKGKKEIAKYKVQIFREMSERFTIYYIQLCGWPVQEQVSLVRGEMLKAFQRLQERYLKKEEGMHTYLDFEESFEKWLMQMEVREEWQKGWKYPIYHDFSTPANLQYILEKIQRTELPQKAYVLGNGIGLNEWIPYVASRVNTISFYLEFATKGMEELQETLLEEYGMLTEINLTARGEFSKLRLRSEEPVLIIDFSGKLPISVLGLKKGSIWVDMDAVDKKRHLIEDRRTGVQYLSLKTIWKREMIQTLDIISKFAYNTEVKIGKF